MAIWLAIYNILVIAHRQLIQDVFAQLRGLEVVFR